MIRLLLLFVPFLLASCASTGASPAPPEMVAEVLFEFDTKIGGCALGDVYPDRPGLEVVVVTGAGEVHVISRAAGLWVADTPLTSPGELIQVAVGDILEERPGDEILAGGMAAGTEDDPGPGKLWVCGRTRKGKWYSEPVLEPTALVHAVLIDDFDPDFRGPEAYSAGFDQLLHRLEIPRTFPGEVDQLAGLDSPAKGICRHLDGIAITQADGALVFFEPNDPNVGPIEIFRADSGLARVASEGDRLLVSSNNGTLWHVTYDGTNEAVATALLVDPEGAKGRGAAFANLGDCTGPMPVTAGYSGQVIGVQSLRDGTFVGHVLHDEGAALHHLSAGDVLPEVPGDELVTVGYSGRVVLLKSN